jgi:hypothetical protein
VRLGNRLHLGRGRVACFMAAVVVASLGIAAPVSAATGIDVDMQLGRAISGTVSGGGSPVAEVNIDVCPPATPYGGPDCFGGQSVSGGQFRLGGLPEGTWLLRVTPPDYPDENGVIPDVAGGFYAGGSVVPSPVGADVLSTVTGDVSVSVDLPSGGHVAGVVSSTAGPVADVTVTACIVTTFNCVQATSDSAGAYDIPGLETDDYLVRIEVTSGVDLQSGFVAHGGIVRDDTLADVVDVVAGSATTVDVTLPAGRHVSGTISGPAGPLEAADVSACLVPDGFPCYSATSASDGTYTVTGLSQASYYVRIIDAAGALPTVFYRSDGITGNYRDGTPVDVSDADATGIDAAVPAPATLDGTVTRPGGEPAEFALVQACLGSCNDANFYGETDATGAYSVGPLPPGDYVVNLFSQGDVLGGYYTSAGLVELEADAESIPIPAGAAASLDLALAEGASISGSLELSDGTPIVGEISACAGEICQSGSVEDGSFQVNGVRPGTYVISFTPDVGTGYLEGYHATGGLVRSPADATPIVIAATEDETVALVVPAESGAIEGTITGEGAGAVADARVVACASADDCGVADSASDGSYLISGLWPDEYQVKVFGIGDFSTSWYAIGGSVTDESLASFVAVGDGGGGSGNTEPGTNVTVEPVDVGTGSSPVTVTFANVSGAGETSLTILSSGPGAPSGYAFADPPAYFDLSTTAAFSGNVEVCIDYGHVPFQGDESLLRLIHRADETWTDITTSQDPAVDEVCGVTTSLSPFVVATELYPFAGFYAPLANPPTINLAKAGAQLTLKFSLGRDLGMGIVAEDSPLSYPIDCTSSARIGPRSVPEFRLTYETKVSRYSIRWRTERAWSGGCREFEVVLLDGSEHSVLFDFRP